MERHKKRSYSFSNWDTNQRIYYDYNQNPPRQKDHTDYQGMRNSKSKLNHHRNDNSYSIYQGSQDITSFSSKNANQTNFYQQRNNRQIDVDARIKRQSIQDNRYNRNYDSNMRKSNHYLHNQYKAYENIENDGSAPTTFAPHRNNIYESKDHYRRNTRIHTEGTHWEDCRESRNSVWQLNKMNEEKLSNIDRINSKIKRILDTLNEEESKINSGGYGYNREGSNSSSNMKIRIGTPSNKNSRDYRIKTEGDYQTGKEYISSMNGDENSSNIYGKLLDIKEKYMHDRHRSNASSLENSQNIKQRDFSENLYTNESKYSGKHNRPMSRQRTPLSSVTQNSLQQRKKQNLTIKNQQKQYENKAWQEKSSQNYGNTLQGLQDIDDTPTFISYHNHNNYQNEEKGNKKNGFHINQDLSRKERSMEKSHHSSHNIFQRNYRQSGNKQFATPTKSRCLSKSRSGKSVKLSNGKDVDAEINRIQLKIDHFNQIKKQLGEDLTPEKWTEHTKQKSTPKIAKSNIIKPRNQFTFNQPTQEITKLQPHQSPLKKFQQEDHSIFQVSLPKPFKLSSKRNRHIMQGNSNVIHIQSALISEDRPYINDSMITVKNTGEKYGNHRECEFNMKKSEDHSHGYLVKTAKKLQCDISKVEERQIRTDYKQIQIFINKICEQIELDSRLRDIKKWFKSYSHPSKWEQLFHMVNGENRRNMDINIIRQIFDLHEEEDNPFLTMRDADGSVAQLMESYVESEENWQRNIGGKLDKNQVQKIMKSMDIERKGWVSVEDVVRYVNVESDQYYRNRDLILIYRRLQGKHLNKKVDLKMLEEQLSL